jgi:iron complex transport system permease protein
LLKSSNKIKWPAILLLLAFLVGIIIISIITGSSYIPIDVLWQDSKASGNEILYQIRLPRIFNAIIIGALLSVAGLLMQNLVKNPLADPYILGLSGATATVQLSIIASGLILPQWLVLLCGFLAATVSLLILLKISYKGKLNTQKLLLSGVVIAFAYAAIISLIISLSPLATTKPILFWLMGDLTYSSSPFIPFILLIMGISLFYKYHRELDILARGEFFAEKCGVNVKKINLMILITTSAFTAIAVSMAGTIGFIGLVTPHLARMMFQNNHADLLLSSAILGAIVLLIADTLARTIVAPIQLPVGIFTALFGVPMFLYLQNKRS